MAKQFSITREIGIDMGHRVTYHGSKCRNLHGHRYTIEATCTGDLYESGEQEGMVLDFGFLKEEMMDVIDKFCDHGTTLWIKDPLLLDFIPDVTRRSTVASTIARQGFDLVLDAITGKLYVVDFVPTAENLAKHWFDRLAPKITERSEGNASLSSIRVWETPNCFCDYPSVRG